MAQKWPIFGQNFNTVQGKGAITLILLPGICSNLAGKCNIGCWKIICKNSWHLKSIMAHFWPFCLIFVKNLTQTPARKGPWAQNSFHNRLEILHGLFTYPGQNIKTKKFVGNSKIFEIFSKASNFWPKMEMSCRNETFSYFLASISVNKVVLVLKVTLY